MPSITGEIQALSVKERKTKYGMKNTYSIRMNDGWFSFGFKNPEVHKGDVVEFEYRTDSYGNQADVKSLTIIEKGPTSEDLGSSTGLSKDKGNATPHGAYKDFSKSARGSFPIHPFDGQRSIIRQNALTNARELYTRSRVFGDTTKALSLEAIDDIIAMAKIFESYTSGDMDVEQAKNELNGNTEGV